MFIKLSGLCFPDVYWFQLPLYVVSHRMRFTVSHLEDMVAQVPGKLSDLGDCA